MPTSIEKRLEALERGKTGRRKRLVVWWEGQPEPRLKKGQPCVRVYRIYMWGNGTPLTPAEIDAYHLRCAAIEVEKAERARVAAEEAEQRQAEALRVATQRAQGAEAAPATLAHHFDQADPAAATGYTPEQLAERGWILTPQGLVMDLRRLGR